MSEGRSVWYNRQNCYLLQGPTTGMSWRLDILFWCLVFSMWCVLPKDETGIEAEETNPTRTFKKREGKKYLVYSVQGPAHWGAMALRNLLWGRIFCRPVMPCLCVRFLKIPPQHWCETNRLQRSWMSESEWVTVFNNTVGQSSCGIPRVTVKRCGYLLLAVLTKLTPWSRGLLEKLTVSHLVKKFPAFYGTRRFITAVTRARHLSLSWASSIQFMSSHPTGHMKFGLCDGEPVC
jgi:hypothetical protein